PYPQAAPIPDRPALDPLIGSLASDLAWDEAAADGRGAYRLRSVDVGQVTSGSGSLGRYPTVVPPSTEADPERERAQAFEERLERAARLGGFLALTTAPRNAERVAREIARRFNVEPYDLDEVLIRRMRETVEKMTPKPRWEAVVKAEGEGLGG